MANMGAQPQATNTRKKLNNSKECEAVFHSGKSHQSWGEGKIVSSHTDILVQDERVLTSEGFCKFNTREKASTQRNTLIHHQKVHARERRYECSHCGKLFSHKSSFLAHQRFNCGGMLYDCSECGKSFSRRKYLIAHRKIHTGEKPYQCNQCGKFLVSKSSLYIREFIVGKGLINAMNVGNLLLLGLPSILI